MDGIILGSHALAAGIVTRQTLRTKYVQVYRNVYAPAGLRLTATHRAVAAWLWSHGTATLVGCSAAAMHGTRWLPDRGPAEIAHSRGSSPPGILIHRGVIADDEICMRASIDCTTPARTAYDLGRWTVGDTGIERIDALLNATGCTVADVEHIAARYPGARGIRRLHAALGLADGGAESPKETELRLLLVRGGLPRPVTQIRVGKRRVDMGWPQWKVGVEYDGEQHWTNPDDYADDIERLEFLASQGWTIVRVSSRQLRYQRDEILRRVRRVLAAYL
ncbi:endonuclease domain-containing protein [Mycolicibacterium sp. XJ1819]